MFLKIIQTCTFENNKMLILYQMYISVISSGSMTLFGLSYGMYTNQLLGSLTVQFPLKCAFCYLSYQTCSSL